MSADAPTTNGTAQTLPAPEERGPQRKPRQKGTAYFWRACAYLYPYRWMVVVSIVCAVFVSAAATSGLGTLLPIMRVLIKGDTIQTWANREVAQKRLELKFADENKDVQVVHLDPDSVAARSGIQEQD